MTHRPRIAVLGSINMDLVVRTRKLPQPGETVLADDAQEISGGKGANQAVGAARLGAIVSLIGRVGSDASAERLLGNLEAEGVETRCVRRTDDCGSGLAVVAVDHKGENSILVVPGANGRVSPRDVDEAQDIIREADILLVQLEIPIETVRYAIELARSSGTRVILNPAPAPRPFPQELLNVDVICPNESEAEAILGRPIRSDDDAKRAAETLAKSGPELAIVTRGVKGVAACEREGPALLLPAIPIKTVDSTAAGDAFTAALAVSLANGYGPEESLRLASAAGAISASRFGAQPSLPNWQEIKERIKLISW